MLARIRAISTFLQNNLELHLVDVVFVTNNLTKAICDSALDVTPVEWDKIPGCKEQERVELFTLHYQNYKILLVGYSYKENHTIGFLLEAISDSYHKKIIFFDSYQNNRLEKPQIVTIKEALVSAPLPFRGFDNLDIKKACEYGKISNIHSVATTEQLNGNLNIPTMVYPQEILLLVRKINWTDAPCCMILLYTPSIEISYTTNLCRYFLSCFRQIEINKYNLT
ncbi:hypothetical protein K4L44_12055 [Halosquirtibacter laminarini]|uniref:Uncharacterized protein n=1 Tax=Halosquirtibacter laminarini TaxID=3374600 RepID=A0AC61NCV4_9BACT|nr:hypothetical protein K4L44_12055 [Prolixibacteraceae bacterium]